MLGVFHSHRWKYCLLDLDRGCIQPVPRLGGSEILFAATRSRTKNRPSIVSHCPVHPFHACGESQIAKHEPLWSWVQMDFSGEYQTSEKVVEPEGQSGPKVPGYLLLDVQDQIMQGFVDFSLCTVWSTLMYNPFSCRSN